ncbi:uncharacterized protein LOC128859225 isoform X1 [Anastrepha ludens]|uniref:uncharacterized protein LOC128859225 isoform X1 n=1 Tax=Anastrepha ludens TaxID=28586 RepID=UPI0023B1FA58|nr:uncharacterized protein LOC128859225 isoform X1 [Anastrepha ludens]
MKIGKLNLVGVRVIHQRRFIRILFSSIHCSPYQFIGNQSLFPVRLQLCTWQRVNIEIYTNTPTHILHINSAYSTKQQQSDRAIKFRTNL